MKTRGWTQGRINDAPIKRIGPWLKLRLLTGDKARPPFEVVHVKLPPGKGYTHVRHLRTHEWIYVLSGSLNAELEGRTILLRPGGTLYIRPRAWHRFWAGRGGLRALSIFCPPIDWKKPDAETREPAPPEGRRAP